MKSEFDTALDCCLSDLASGATLDTCLARHPEHAAELRPLLELAADLHHVATPSASPAAQVAGRQRMLAALAARPRGRSVPGRVWQRLAAGLRAPAWRPAAALVVLVILAAAAAFVLAASTTALPGDRLYPVKLARQEVQLALTLDPAKEQILQRQFATARRLDVHTALALGRTAHVRFEGVLESLDGERWLVGSLPVVVSDATRIDGKPYPGAPVEVEGDLSGSGDIRATSVVVDADHAPWPEPTRTQTSTPTPTPTSRVLPRTATYTATAELSATPTSTHTAVPAAPATNTPHPTATPSPTDRATSMPTPTASVTATAAATSIPASPSPPPPTAPVPTQEPAEPEDTPEPPHPSETPRSTGIPLPSQTPHPTDMPHPTETPRPSETPEPTETPKFTRTPEPTETPKPSKTPQPTETPEPDDDGKGDSERGARELAGIIPRC